VPVGVFRARRSTVLSVSGLLLATALSVHSPAHHGAAAAEAGEPAASQPHSYNLLIAPRLQWNANYGYCGETSLISAGMYFGQYTSQWTARSLASPGIPQTEQDSQLLLGINDLTAASSMKLDAEAFPSAQQTSTPQFLTWVTSMVLRDRPVIVGLLLNMRRSDGQLPGDAEYDHIVPILGITTRTEQSATNVAYRPTDTVTFSDNSGASATGIFTASFRGIQRSRTAANRAAAPLYSLLNRPMNYGIAVSGVSDPTHVTIPIRLTSSSDGEGVQDQRWLDTPPPAQPLTLTATVTIPDPSLAYNVYLYDDFTKVPMSNFNASAGNAIQQWTIPVGSSSTWSQTISAMSDQTRVFRAVPTTAP
jgi:hypothetical protein